MTFFYKMGLKDWNENRFSRSWRLGSIVNVGWNPNHFPSDIERVYRSDYKSPDSLIYVKFVSWKVSQAVLHNIIKVNRSRQTNIYASQRYSDKVQKRMNKLLITRKEFKNDKEFLEELCKVPRSVHGQKAWGLKLQCIHGSQWLGMFFFLLTIN